MMNRRQFNQGMMSAAGAVVIGDRLAVAGAEPLMTRAIPSSGERIPIVGVGTNRYGVGNDRQLRAPLKDALRRFHELGGSVVDTAPSYRSSEIVLGNLIAELGIGDDLFMATKVDVEGKQACADRMQRSFDRLNAERIELMQVHNFIGWRDALAVMREWKQDGRIRYIGVTTSRAREYGKLEDVMMGHELDFIQVDYSLANQRTSADRILPLAAERGMAVLVNRPFGGGGVFTRLAKARFPEWAAEFGALSWGQFMLKYVLSHPAVTCSIPGMTKVSHVSDNMAAADGLMPDATQRSRMESFFDALPA